MHIVIKEENKQIINMRMPTGLVFNRMNALFIPSVLKKHGICITYQQCCAFLKVLNSYRRAHKDWVLAEVDSADGERVFIKL